MWSWRGLEISWDDRVKNETVLRTESEEGKKHPERKRDWSHIV
jgi:hypothetical protein